MIYQIHVNLLLKILPLFLKNKNLHLQKVRKEIETSDNLIILEKKTIKLVGKCGVNHSHLTDCIQKKVHIRNLCIQLLSVCGFNFCYVFLSKIPSAI